MVSKESYLSIFLKSEALLLQGRDIICRSQICPQFGILLFIDTPEL